MVGDEEWKAPACLIFVPPSLCFLGKVQGVRQGSQQQTPVCTPVINASTHACVHTHTPHSPAAGNAWVYMPATSQPRLKQGKELLLLLLLSLLRDGWAAWLFTEQSASPLSPESHPFTFLMLYEVPEEDPETQEVRGVGSPGSTDAWKVAPYSLSGFVGTERDRVTDNLVRILRTVLTSAQTLIQEPFLEKAAQCWDSKDG